MNALVCSPMNKKHGDGPRHCAAVMNGVTLEIYAAEINNESITKGFDVDALEKFKAHTIQAGGELPHEPSSHKPYLIIRDIDGRTMIFSNNKA